MNDDNRIVRLKARLIAAQGRGDADEVRRILAALQRLRAPENALQPKTTETRGSR